MDKDKPDRFMQKFKLLKRRQPPPDLSSVINPDVPSEKLVLRLALSEIEASAGLRSPDSWRLYELAAIPGAYLIRDPFLPLYKKYWISRCLADYQKKPNVSNLDVLQPRGDKEDVWMEAIKEKATPAARKRLKSLRWVTLGYHYDWTNKIYRKEAYSKFPPDLASLANDIISCVLGRNKMVAEAAIVNYYHQDSCLSGHTDHSEFDLQAPLVSISFGVPCVFMIGGKTKEQESEAIFLRDGDVIIMSGFARMSYHAVPKVLPADFIFPTTDRLSEGEPSWKRTRSDGNSEPGKSETDLLTIPSGHFCEQTVKNVAEKNYWEPFREYLASSRININIRQLFEPGKGPDDYNWPTTDPQPHG